MSEFLKYRNDKWNQFLEKYKVKEIGVELFSHEDLEVEVNFYGKSNCSGLFIRWSECLY